MGKATELVQGIVNAILAAGGGDEDLDRVRKDPEFYKEVAKLVMTRRVLSDVYTIDVNYDLSIEEAIAAGKYDWSNSDISSAHFSTSRSGKVEIEVASLHFGRSMTSEEVLAEMDKHGLRAAELHELLGLGAQHPDLQRRFLIVALGSVWQSFGGRRHVPYLYCRNASERSLDHYWLTDKWGFHCSFAAVSK